MSVQRILIAVDGSPLAAHAADVGVELARSLAGEVALIHGVDPAQNWAPESGVPTSSKTWRTTDHDREQGAFNRAPGDAFPARNHGVDMALRVQLGLAA